MTIGLRIRMARKMRMMSQRDLSRKSGIKSMKLSKFERDVLIPASGELLLISTSLDVPVGYFFRADSVFVEIPC